MRQSGMQGVMGTEVQKTKKQKIVKNECPQVSIYGHSNSCDISFLHCHAFSNVSMLFSFAHNSKIYKICSKCLLINISLVLTHIQMCTSNLPFMQVISSDWISSKTVPPYHLYLDFFPRQIS